MPIIIPGSSTANPTNTSPSSLNQIRQYMATELGGDSTGGFKASTVTSGSVAQLTDIKWPVNTSLDVSEQWQDAWILRPDASTEDRVRIVSEYTPNGGIFLPDLNWTNAPTSGEAYEIHTVLEPDTALLRCINFGLRRCMVKTEFSFVPIGGATWHSMSLVAPWLIDSSWVRQLGYLSNNEDRNQIDPFERVIRGEAVDDGGTVILSHPDKMFGAQGQITNPYIIYVKAMIPAYELCFATNQSYGSASAITTNGTSWLITIPSTTGMVVGQTVVLAGFTPSTYNGTFVIMDIPSTTTFRVQSISQPTTPSVFGSVTSTLQKSGVSDDTDRVPIRTEWAAWAAIVEAWRHYGQALDTTARQRLVPNRIEAASAFSVWTRNCSKWPKKTFRPILAGGPLITTSYGGAPSAYRATTA